jgi:preprotein translocase subunit YajC
MNWNTLTVFFALGAPATPAGTQQNPTASLVSTIVMMGAVLVIFYVLMLRPQRVQAKKLENLMKSLKPGDKILTGSGIVGVVVSVKEKTISIRSADTKLEILRSAVSEVTERANEPSQP